MAVGCYDATWLRLEAIPGLGPKKAQKLLEKVELEQLFELSNSELQQLGFNPAQCRAIHHPPKRVELAIEWLAASNRHLLHWKHPSYPHLLKQINDPPIVLFVEGNPDLLSRQQLAIVGSRHATTGGIHITRRLAAELAQQGMVVTSGLALGIDAAAHHGALETGITIAVVATGLDRVYPKRHERLAAQIRNQGALVSEFFPGTPPKAELFPRRNRIISGLSRGVLVVEAAIRSGSLITTRFAADQGREVFAVPGSIDNPLCSGPHLLIQQGAKLVTCVNDIWDELGENLVASEVSVIPGTDNNRQQQLPFSGLLDNVGYETTGIDEVVESSSLPVEEVVRQLTELEILGVIAAVPGGYIRLRRHP